MSDLIYILAGISLVPLIRIIYSLIVERREADRRARFIESLLKRASESEKSDEEKIDTNIKTMLREVFLKEVLKNGKLSTKNREKDLDARLFEVWYKNQVLKAERSNKKPRIELRFPDGTQFELKNSNDLDKVVNLLKEGMKL